MVKAIRVHEIGGPEVLKWEDVEIGEPKDGEIKVKNKAIGINFIDVYFRKGVYKASSMPFTPGMEAVGVVIAVGPGLTGRKVGDLVAYAGTPMGSYAEEQILPADKVVPVPPSIDPVTAASIMLKGMTVQVLLRRCFKVEPGHTVLIHAAAGGVGSLLCQWANACGATVIGAVSTKEKATQAQEDGCHHVIVYKEEDFVTRINEITSGKGVEVVYDSVGKDTFEGSLACLKVAGYMVSFGQSSGTPDPVPLSALAAKSLFLTRPSLMHYTSTRDELLAAAGEVFANVASGVIQIKMTTPHFFAFLLLLSVAAAATSTSSNECVYNLYVQTGSFLKAGTDSNICVTLGDSIGKSVWISNLTNWGLMGPNYDYYERGNLDIFTGLGPCIGSPICRLNVTSDGSGAHHGWFLDYIEVTSTGPHKECTKSIFYVDQWLATDAPPYQLSAILDGCKEHVQSKNRPYVVRKFDKLAFG